MDITTIKHPSVKLREQYYCEIYLINTGLAASLCNVSWKTQSLDCCMLANVVVCTHARGAIPCYREGGGKRGV